MLKNRRIRFAGLIAAVSAIALLSACSSAPAESTGDAGTAEGTGTLEELVDAAKAEGSLTLYGDGGEPTLQAWTQAFTAEYGITVNILRLAGSELFQRFSQEKVAGQNLADVYSATNRPDLDTAVENGWIAEYEPAAGGEWPEEHTRAGFYYPVQNGYFMSVAYNVDMLTAEQIELIREDPIGAAGDPQFEGLVAVGAPQASQHAAAFHYLQTQSGEDWSRLEDVAANKPTIYIPTLTMLQGLIAGEYAIAVGVTDSLVAPQILSGAPIEFAYPLETTGGYFNTAVVEDAPHPNAARLFLEWATTAEASELYTEITQTIPANSEVDDSRELVQTDWYTDPAIDDVWFTWITDDEFLGASGADGDFLDQWREVFSYSG